MVRLSAAVALALIAAPAFAHDEASLSAAIERRFGGDRSGACIAAAVIDDRVSTAIVCADATRPRAIDRRTRFEIGSVGKTMTAALVADAIARGEVTLDTPLAEMLPAGSVVPGFGEDTIRLRHLVTHTSGLPRLPPGFAPRDASDPYADFEVDDALAALRAVTLTQAPGTRWEYSNFGYMLLGYALQHRLDTPFGELLKQRLFEPLGMRDAVLEGARGDARAAQGHLATREPAAPWTGPDALGGAGGMRASLDDMIRYVAAQLGRSESPLAATLRATQAPVEGVAGQGEMRMGMGWLRLGGEGGARLWHDGGTGGFSSTVMLDPARARGVVLLSDTSLLVVGGLDELASHLLDPEQPLGTARVAATPDPALIDALVGEYVLDGGLALELRRERGGLVIQAQGQPPFPMGFDSRGDFHPLAFDALLTPLPGSDGTRTLRWSQGGAVMTATRIDRAAEARAASQPGAPLTDYVGHYPLAPQFVLRVFEQQGALQVQATGQGALRLVPIRPDVFRTDGVAAEVHFQRDASGKVAALALHQNGLVQNASRE